MDINLVNSFYDTLLQGEGYYNILVREYVNCRSFDRNEVIFQYPDRGNKYNLVWDYFISPVQAESFRERHSAEFSYFKEWLNLKTNNGIIIQLIELRKYIELLNSEKVLKVAQHNHYECYGICMMLFELLNKCYISTRKKSNQVPYCILRFAFLYSMTYSKYHLNWDVLKSVDVLSNFARMHDYFGKETIILLLDGAITNLVGVKFMYIWAMQKCYEILPDIYIKLHYHTNAKMMHQNQTVGGVSGDALETPFYDCYKLGEGYSAQILQSYEDTTEVNGFFIEDDILSEEMSNTFSIIFKDNLNNASINRMRFLNKTIQIEKFDGKHIVTPPYIPAPIHYISFLKEIGLQEDHISKLKVREEAFSMPFVKYSIRIEDILGKPIEYSEKTYFILKNKGIDTDAFFRDIVIMTDENKNLHSILITGNHLYPIKKDIDWTGLFYGIPCKVIMHDFGNKMYEDRLTLVVFGLSETCDKTLFNSEN